MGLVQSSKAVTLFHMTELAERPEHTDEALSLGPQSLVWRYFGDNRMYLIGPRPAVLQNMLAELGQDVLDHSTFFADTAARLKRTIPPIFNTVYGSDDDNAGLQVRDFHHHVKGDMPDGGRYHALDPDTYFWAHATFVEQVLYFADTFVKRLTEAEKEQVYLEAKTWYRRYGVSDRPMPANYAEFERYWDRMMDVFLTTGGLPPRARDLLGLPWSDRQERRYQRFAAFWRSRPVNWVWDHLPMRLRYNGYALKGYARS